MKIPILGVGSTPFGELWHASIADLLSQSQHEALRDASLASSDIDMLFVANMGAEQWNGQAHVGALAADVLGIHVPTMRVESACASGGMALAAGVMAIMSGAARVVMVSGVEKMTDVDPALVTAGLMSACLWDAEYMAGASFASLFALVTRQYFQTYGIGREHLAAVSVKNHEHALCNPLAHLHKKITIDDVLHAPIVADPLSLLDCSPISDGAATIILGADKPSRINIIASAQATDTMTIAARPTLTSFAATKAAAACAYAQAGITPDLIDVAEVHDAFTMAELIALEDLGFCAPGAAAYQNFVRGKETAKQSSRTIRTIINPSGGLKAKGHPIGATGVGQAVEVVKFLRGDERRYACPSKPQGEGAGRRRGLTHNMGGVGTTVAVHIFEREPVIP
jgi:acetyl-CoA C-acetyltransferase